MSHYLFLVFFFNDTATTEIYTLSLHDALPISLTMPAALTVELIDRARATVPALLADAASRAGTVARSEEHTSELQSHHDLVCRLLLEKKKKENIEIQRREHAQRRDPSHISRHQ